MLWNSQQRAPISTLHSALHGHLFSHLASSKDHGLSMLLDVQFIKSVSRETSPSCLATLDY
jgi:hypothetical protein